MRDLEKFLNNAALQMAYNKPGYEEEMYVDEHGAEELTCDVQLIQLIA